MAGTTSRTIWLTMVSLLILVFFFGCSQVEDQQIEEDLQTEQLFDELREQQEQAQTDTDVETEDDDTSTLNNDIDSNSETRETSQSQSGWSDQLQGRFMERNVSVEVEAGASTTALLIVENTGTETWTSSLQPSLNAFTGNLLVPTFATDDWVSSRRPVLLARNDIATGNVVLAEFGLQAPQVAGVYTLPFILTHVDDDGRFVRFDDAEAYVTVHVTAPVVEPAVLGEQITREEQEEEEESTEPPTPVEEPITSEPAPETEAAPTVPEELPPAQPISVYHIGGNAGVGGGSSRPAPVAPSPEPEPEPAPAPEEVVEEVEDTTEEILPEPEETTEEEEPTVPEPIVVTPPEFVLPWTSAQTSSTSYLVQGTATGSVEVTLVATTLAVDSVLTVDQDGTWEQALADMVDGMHTLTAVSQDILTGTTSTEVVATLTVDTVAPTINDVTLTRVTDGIDISVAATDETSGVRDISVAYLFLLPGGDHEASPCTDAAGNVFHELTAVVLADATSVVQVAQAHQCTWYQAPVDTSSQQSIVFSDISFPLLSVMAMVIVTDDVGNASQASYTPVLTGAFPLVTEDIPETEAEVATDEPVVEEEITSEEDTAQE